MPFRKLTSHCALALVLAGAASTAVIAGETFTYTYDTLGRLIIAKSTGTINNNHTASYCYDAAGNRTLVRTDTAGATANCSSSPTPSPTPTPTPTPTPAPSISIGNSSAEEGGSMLFSVSLSQAPTSSMSVSYVTSNGSAGSYDFYAKNGTLTFSAGQTSQAISVSTKADSVNEPNETFTVNLSSPTGGASISDGQGVGTIIDSGLGEPTCGEFLC